MSAESDIKDERKRWRMKRLEKEIQLKDMEKDVGVSYNMISMYEKGKANLLPERVVVYKKYIEEH